MSSEKHKRDSWSTPDEFFAAVDSVFNFTLDCCATVENTKCRNFIAAPGHKLNRVETLRKHGKYLIGIDAMTTAWHMPNREPRGTVVWCNPPYSNVDPWFARARAMQQLQITVVMLTHAGLASQWFNRYAAYASSIWSPTPRINFRPAKGIKGESNNRDSLLFIFSGVPHLPPTTELAATLPMRLIPFPWKTTQRSVRQ